MKIQQIGFDKLNYASPQLRRDLRHGLDELKTSIESEGVLFPVIVRKSGAEYIIIDGNRRVMALDELGAKPSDLVPAVVVSASDEEALKLEMISNLVRQNLSPMEEAEVIHMLVKSYGMKAAEVARARGKSAGRVSDILKIFSLPKEIVAALRKDKITINHARTLARYADDPALVMKIYRRILKDKIGSEDIVPIAYIMSMGGKARVPAFAPTVEKLADGTRIKIEPRKKTVRIEINYNPNGKLNAVLDVLKQKVARIF